MPDPITGTGSYVGGALVPRRQNPNFIPPILQRPAGEGAPPPNPSAEQTAQRTALTSPASPGVLDNRPPSVPAQPSATATYSAPFATQLLGQGSRFPAALSEDDERRVRDRLQEGINERNQRVRELQTQQQLQRLSDEEINRFVAERVNLAGAANNAYQQADRLQPRSTEGSDLSVSREGTLTPALGRVDITL